MYKYLIYLLYIHTHIYAGLDLDWQVATAVMPGHIKTIKTTTAFIFSGDTRQKKIQQQTTI